MKSIHLIKAGVITAAGGNAVQTTGVVNAGINCYKNSSQFNNNRKPMKFAAVPNAALPPLNKQLENVAGLTLSHKQMLRLSDSALRECVLASNIVETLAVFLALPEASRVPSSFVNCLAMQSGVNLDTTNSRLLATGRAGGIQAIEIAFKYFEATGKEFAIIGGVDTFVGAQQHLAKLDAEGRILAEEVVNGYAPGEAAGFLLVASETAQAKYHLNSQLSIYRPGLAEEVGHLYSDQPYRGEGLSTAFQQAIAQGPQKPIQTIYSSQNGENFWAKELGVATIRNSASFSTQHIHEHPADCLGDIGAAFGPVLLTLASHQSSSSIVYCSSDGSSRAATCVTK